MDSDPNTISPPWQPLTFGGAAGFARCRFSRFFLVALAFAAMVAGAVVRVFYFAWEPSIRQSITHLPDEGAIRGGQLDWQGQTPIRLAEGNFFSIVVDLAGTGELGYASDLQCELGRTEFRLRSLLGHAGLPYPTTWIIALNRRKLEPWWGAWHPVVAASLAASVVAGLFVTWTLLGACYALPIQLIAFYADRPVSAFGAWRLGVASLLPGALLMSASILAYGFQQLNLIQLAFAWLIHIPLGWAYVLISPWRLPRCENAPGARGKKPNPFQ